MCISERSVSHLLDRYDELLAISLFNSERIRAIVSQQKRVILAIDGLQPDMGHEVLWVIQRLLKWRNSTGKNLVVCTESGFSRPA